MLEDGDIDGLAAEYVLGSLDAAERARVDARRQTDRQLAEAIAAWERRLGALSDREPGLAPPAHAFDSILARISGQAAPSRRTSSRRWAFAAGAGTLAAGLVLAFVWFNSQPPPQLVESRMDCGKLYKDFWQKGDPQRYVRISPEQLAGVSRLALRAYDACQAGDEQDARALLARLRERSGGPPAKSFIVPG